MPEPSVSIAFRLLLPHPPGPSGRMPTMPTFAANTCGTRVRTKMPSANSIMPLRFSPTTPRPGRVWPTSAIFTISGKAGSSEKPISSAGCEQTMRGFNVPSGQRAISRTGIARSSRHAGPHCPASIRNLAGTPDLDPQGGMTSGPLGSEQDPLQAAR